MGAKMKSKILLILLTLVSIGSSYLFADSCLNRDQLLKQKSNLPEGWRLVSAPGKEPNHRDKITFEVGHYLGDKVRCTYEIKDKGHIIIEKNSTSTFKPNSDWKDSSCGRYDISVTKNKCTWEQR